MTSYKASGIMGILEEGLFNMLGGGGQTHSNADM